MKSMEIEKLYFDKTDNNLFIICLIDFLFVLFLKFLFNFILLIFLFIPNKSKIISPNNSNKISAKFQAFLLFFRQSERSYKSFPIAPIFLYLNPTLQINFYTKEILQFLSGKHSCLFQHCSALSYNNSLM